MRDFDGYDVMKIVFIVLIVGYVIALVYGCCTYPRSYCPSCQHEDSDPDVLYCGRCGEKTIVIRTSGKTYRASLKEEK